MSKKKPNPVTELRDRLSMAPQPVENSQNEHSVAHNRQEDKASKRVKPHLKCPCCHPRLGGTGVQKGWFRISGRTTRLKYTCNQCGFTWAVEKKVEHTIVAGDEIIPVDSRDDDDDN